MLRDWWAPEDAAKFTAQAEKYGAQYEAINFPQLPGQHIIGKLTMGENIGDLGGILMALDAYHISLKGKPAPVLDGFTGDQRVFLGWGQVWRTMMRDDALRQLIMTNPHSPRPGPRLRPPPQRRRLVRCVRREGRRRGVREARGPGSHLVVFTPLNNERPPARVAVFVVQSDSY
jgi:hypothetical protein